MADYGQAENLLECVPTYIHKVPSFNAADVWMMREFAGILQTIGEPNEARQMDASAVDARRGCRGLRPARSWIDGAYDAWPAVTVDAMCSLGYWGDAISFLRRTQAAIYEGVYAQAHEFYGPTRGQYDAPVRIAQREGCMRECTGGGAFAETIIGTLFGYAAKPGRKLELMDAANFVPNANDPRRHSNDRHGDPRKRGRTTRNM